MRNDPLYVLSRRFRTLHLYSTAALVGAVIGVFVLYPFNEWVYYLEHEQFRAAHPHALDFVFGQLRDSLHGHMPQKTLLYALAGASLGTLTALLYATLHHRWLEIQHLSEELGKDLDALIQQGEGPHLEFKSSWRWDVAQARVNKALEQVILKTLAGFLNHAGGSLLIGVADDGTILGLEHDYRTLKRADRDGFEQALMTAVANQLGADICRYLHVIFHVIDGKEICRVVVSPAERPVFLQVGNDPKLYVRTGGGTRELNVQEAMDYVASRWPKK